MQLLCDISFVFESAHEFMDGLAGFLLGILENYYESEKVVLKKTIIFEAKCLTFIDHHCMITIHKIFFTRK